MSQQPMPQDPIVDLSWLEVAGSAGLVLLAIGITWRFRTGLARTFVVAALRTAFQLALVGYVLVYIFAMDRWWLVLLALLAMTAVAGREATQRQESPSRRLAVLSGLAILVGAGLTLVYVGGLLVRPEPWYSPRYLIPLFGMIVSTALDASALAADRLAGEMEARRPEVEAYLALGASPERAARRPVRNALRASLIPMVNRLMIVGLVALPGMMTGQILSGTSPLTAVRWQIVVMFMLAGAAAVAGALTTVGYRSEFFTPAHQLRKQG